MWASLQQAISSFFDFSRSVLQVVALSIQVSGGATLLAAGLGIPVGLWLGLTRFRGRGFAAAVVNTGFALPPVVVGLAVYLMLSRHGPLGSLNLLYTWQAMIIAQFIIAWPVVVALTMAATATVPKDVRLQAYGLGASRRQALWLVIRSARISLMAAVVAAFGAVISEVGAVMMVGGNIRRADGNVTAVMTTDIVQRVSQGDTGGALALGGVLLLTAFAVSVVLTRLELGRGGRWVNS
jgi:tungstate transport system permease protein